MTVSFSSPAENPQQTGHVNYLMKPSSFQKEGHESITTEAPHEVTRGQTQGMKALHTPINISTPSPRTIAIKPQVGVHSFEGHEPAVAPFAWQSSKALVFCFAPNSVSEVQFGTGAWRPSFRRQFR